MSPFPRVVAEQLGRRLQAEGFQPLPDVDDDGILIGTLLWRLRAGYVEYLALSHTGHALAVRAAARFTYQSPHRHGPVTGHRSGPALDALDWLVTSTPPPTPPTRPDRLPNRSGRHHLPDKPDSPRPVPTQDQP